MILEQRSSSPTSAENLLGEISSNLKVLTEEIRTKKGQVFGFDIGLTQNANPTFIDFLKLSNNINVPAGTPVITPGEAVFIVDLANVGPGTLKHSINLSVNEGGTKSLLAGQSVRYESGRAKYKNITMRAVGGNVWCNIGFEL